MAFGKMAKAGISAALILLAACGSPQERAAKYVTRFEQFYGARDFVNARIEIRKAIAIEDDVAEYWNRLGRAELGLSNYYPAYTAYQRAFELDKDNVEALQAMAELAYSGGNSRDSVRLADQMLEREPRNLRMLLVKGAVALDDRDYGQVRELITRMLAVDPENEGAIVLLGRVLFATGQPERGASLIEGSIARTGPTMLKLNALVENYAAQHDIEGLYRSYRRMFAIDRSSVGLRLDYAKALYENDEPARALAIIDRLQRARPRDAELNRHIIELWDMVGSDAIDLDAVRRFAAAGNDEMKLALANLAIEQGRFGEAITILKPFVTDDRITPGNVSAQMLYARAISGLGNKAEALARTDRILAFDSTNPDALLLRVNVEIDRKTFDDALNDAQILGRDNPHSPPARLALARVYAARNESVLADTSFASALGDLPDSVEIVRAYTGWLVAMNRAGRALGVATRFTERNPRSLKGWAIRVDLCLRLKDRDCMTESAAALEHLRGGQKMRAPLIAAMQGADAAR